MVTKIQTIDNKIQEPYSPKLNDFYLDNSIERQLVLNFKEGDHKLALIGIKNICFGLLKLDDDDYEEDESKKEKLISKIKQTLSVFPKGVKIIGILLCYNDSLYEDFESLGEEGIKLLTNLPYELISKSLYSLLTKEVLFQSKFEFEEKNLFFINKEKEIVKEDVNYKLVNINYLLKSNFGFCYSNISIQKDILNSESFNSKKDYYKNIKKSKVYCSFSDEFVLDVSDFLLKNPQEKSEINLLIKNSVKNAIDFNKSYSEITDKKNINISKKLIFHKSLLNRFTQEDKIVSVKENKTLENVPLELNSFLVESEFNIKFKTKENEFIDYSECIDENSNKFDKIEIADCFLFSLDEFESESDNEANDFARNFEDSIKSLIDKIEKLAALETNDNEIIFSQKIFYNHIIFPSPLIIEIPRKNKDNSINYNEFKDVIESLLKHSKYFINNYLLSNTSKDEISNFTQILKRKNLLSSYPNNFDKVVTTSKPINPHLSLLEKTLSDFDKETSKTSIVKGVVEFFHYLQDNFNDDGWGCAYRSLQTLYSWFFHNNLLNKNEFPNTPSIPEIQKTLVDAGDKLPKIINSKDWIGAFEVNIVLNHLLGIESQIIYLPSGADIKSKAREIANHFDTIGTPIMVGGGVYAYTILGINYDFTSGECKFLIQDPHYKDKDDVSVILAKGGISWKSEALFEKGNFYNLCLPQLPDCTV